MPFCLVLVVSVVLGSPGICVKSVPLSSQSFLTGLVLQAGFSGGGGYDKKRLSA